MLIDMHSSEAFDDELLSMEIIDKYNEKIDSDR